jgi:hypothetical protein
MPKSANSIDCPCGGYYTKKNRTKHMKTKKHQKYEEEQLEKCANCNEKLTEDTHIFTLSKDEEEKTWCETCFNDCGRDAREDGWKFDEQGEDLLDTIECLHCGEDTLERYVACEHCNKNYNEENCNDKDCEHCSDKCDTSDE